MKKKLIRLTESDLHRIVKETVNKVMREDTFRFGNNGEIYNDKGQLVYTPKLPDSSFPHRYDDGETPFGREKHRIVKKSVNKVVKEDYDRGMALASTLRGEVEDLLTRNGFEYDLNLNGFNVYPDSDNIVIIKIYKEPNIPYPRR